MPPVWRQKRATASLASALSQCLPKGPIARGRGLAERIVLHPEEHHIRKIPHPSLESSTHSLTYCRYMHFVLVSRPSAAS